MKINMICDCEKFANNKATFFHYSVYVYGDLRKPQEIRRGQYTVFSMRQTLKFEAKILLRLFIRIVISKY